METPENIEKLSQKLRQVLGGQYVSTKANDRIAYARDQWQRSLIRFRHGQLENLPDLVIWPKDAQQAAEALRICYEAEIPIMPVGAGSAVTGAASPIYKGVIIDLKRLNRIRTFRADKSLVDVESGFVGLHLEEALERAGCTLGHFPSSILCSSLGGWVATRSAGQNSSLYGKIEDMVVDLEIALPTGEVRWLEGDFTLLELFMGSEGRFGLITAVRLRVHPAPKARTFRGLIFPTLENAWAALRQLMQKEGNPPAVLRLYDNAGTFISSHPKAKGSRPQGHQHIYHHTTTLPMKLEPKSNQLEKRLPTWLEGLRKRLSSTLKEIIQQGAFSAMERAQTTNKWIHRLTSSSCLLIVGCEGYDNQDAEQQMQQALKICDEEQAKDLGPNPGWHWFDTRHDVSFKQPQAFRSGAFADTMEVAASWSQLPDLYKEVKGAIQKDALVMAHFSHAYAHGCSIYFSFISHDSGEKELSRYDRIWRNGIQAAIRAGGTISHHHGVGVNKSQGMQDELGVSGLETLQKVAESFDPEQLLNPGKLTSSKRFS